MAPTTTRNVEQTLRLFRALGDETRLRLIERLRGGEQCVGDLKPTRSGLRVLRPACD